MIYSLTYELKNPDKDYSSLFDLLEKKIGLGGIHVTRDNWWIATEEPLNIDSVCETIRKELDPKDHFFLTLLSSTEINGWLPTSSWEFFKKNVNTIKNG